MEEHEQNKEMKYGKQQIGKQKNWRMANHKNENWELRKSNMGNNTWETKRIYNMGKLK